MVNVLFTCDLYLANWIMCVNLWQMTGSGMPDHIWRWHLSLTCPVNYNKPDKSYRLKH